MNINLRYFQTITLFSLLLVLTLPLVISAEEKEAEISYNISLELAFSKCVNPEKPPCYAFNEKDKEKCPNCITWEQGFIGQKNKLIPFNELEYSYDKGKRIPRANFLLRDAAKIIYETEFPKTEYGYPVTIGTIYKNPEKYDWVELSSDAPKAGALAIWPNIGGVVVNHKGVALQEEVIVLYPSDKLKGRLNTIKASKLSKEGVPKYIIPKQILDSQISSGLKE